VINPAVAAKSNKPLLLLSEYDDVMFITLISSEMTYDLDI